MKHGAENSRESITEMKKKTGRVKEMREEHGEGAEVARRGKKGVTERG